AMQFREFLEERGYARSLIIRSGALCRHFIVWLYLSDIPLAATDERIRNRFLAHDCTCVHPGFLDRPSRFAGSDSSGSILRLFAAFLVDRSVIPAPKVPQSHVEHGEHLDAFLHWLRQHRGLRDTSIEHYERRVRTLLPGLGDAPGAYDAARVRNTILGRLETASRGQVGGEASACRMYLRFLGSNGLCRPELVHAVPTIPRLRCQVQFKTDQGFAFKTDPPSGLFLSKRIFSAGHFAPVFGNRRNADLAPIAAAQRHALSAWLELAAVAGTAELVREGSRTTRIGSRLRRGGAVGDNGGLWSVSARRTALPYCQLYGVAGNTARKDAVEAAPSRRNRLNRLTAACMGPAGSSRTDRPAFARMARSRPAQRKAPSR
ncbi:MAG: hypothetical protein OXF56_09860, partial [Rhodobacteraceae bacterium]|nr:hypothetical protein [Paracoccaceae bacterium]